MLGVLAQFLYPPSSHVGFKADNKLVISKLVQPFTFCMVLVFLWHSAKEMVAEAHPLEDLNRVSVPTTRCGQERNDTNSSQP